MVDDLSPGLRLVGASAGPRATKQQQRFGKLVKDVARLKEAVRAWSHAQPELHRGVADCAGRQAEHRAELAELVRLFDRTHGNRALTRRERAYLRGVLCELALEILEAELDEGAAATLDIKAIYNRHSRGDFDAETEFHGEIQTRMMRTLLEESLGFDFGRADIRSLDELHAAAAAQMEDVQRAQERRAEEAAEQRARRKRSARQVTAEARRDAERAQVGKALQEVYRRLAMALHPDREPDPAERARKTLLMQEVNAAYERKDLLQLLELQLRFEQLDEAQIGSLAAERLERYNQLLAEQVGQLKEELAELELPWRMQLGLPPTGKLLPARVLTLLREDLAELREAIERVRNDLQRFADPRALKAWLAMELAAAARRDRRRDRDPF